MSAFSHLRTHRRLAFLVLPALLLRALIPVGFMPLAGAAGMFLGLCPGASLGQGMAHVGHAGHGISHEHHHSGGGSDPGGTHRAPCLFSAGASAGFATPLAAPALASAALTAPVDRSPARLFVPAILRAQSSRGPPSPA
jgi:hypothetical protein